MESIIIFMLGGTTVSALGILIYLGIQPLIKNYSFLFQRLFKFLYSITISILLYTVSYFIMNKFFDIQLGFSEITPSGIASSILIYAGTTFLTKGNADIA